MDFKASQAANDAGQRLLGDPPATCSPADDQRDLKVYPAGPSPTLMAPHFIDAKALAAMSNAGDDASEIIVGKA